MKNVTVMGTDYHVPDNINFVTVDEDGAISGFTSKPEVQDFEEDNIWCDGNTTYTVVGDVDVMIGDWKDSLQDITNVS